MKLKVLYSLSLSLTLTFLCFPAFGQLHFENLVYDGLGQPLLGNPSGVGVSPEGNHVYVISYNDGAINTYTRDASGNIMFDSSLKTDINGVSGLSGAISLTVSPEGNNVYVAGSFDHSVAVFSRNVTTGELTFVEKQINGVGSVMGLTGATNMAVSPDGNYLYVTGGDDNSLVVFQRNVLTGSLSFMQVFQDENGDVNDLNYPVSVDVSPDGNNVYVASYGDNAITIFSKNASNGMLSFQEVVRNGVAGVSDLGGAYSVMVSPDGSHVYTAGIDAASVSSFTRATNGSLTLVANYVDGVDGVSGLEGINAISFSPDGAYLMATGGNFSTLVMFNRDASTGMLMFNTKIEDGVDGVTGMYYPFTATMTPDMKNIFVPGFGGEEFVMFEMDGAGMVTYKSTESAGTDGVDGLGGASAMAISSDGKNIYVTGDEDNAVSFFDRNDDSGMMNYIGNLKDGVNGVDGLAGANGITISPNGKFVYTSGFWDNAISVFARDAITGELTFISQMVQAENGVDGIHGANSLTMSPDGNHLYVTGFWSGTLAMFSADPTTGMLTYMDFLRDGVDGVDGLNRANSIRLSPDGNNVYVTGSSDDALAMFNRDASTGMLTYVAHYKNNVNGVSFMDAPFSSAVSPDGTKVYVASNRSDALVVFDRNMMDGTLTYAEAFVNGENDVTGLDGVRSVEVSADGLYVYTASDGDNSAAVFRKNVNTGSLVFEKSRQDNVEGVNGIDSSSDIEVSPNGRHIYVTGNSDNALALFSCTYLVTLAENICEGDSVVVGANTYKTPGVYKDTFAIGSCNNIVTLELDVQSKNNSMDVKICAGDAYEFAGVIYEETGSYTEAYKSIGGCDSIMTLNLEVVDNFEPEMVKAEICYGEKYVFGTVAYEETGTYTEVTMTTFGCEKTTILELNVLPAYDEQISEVICEGDFFVFGTSNYTTSGIYTEMMRSSNGCDSLVTLNLVVIPTDGTPQTTSQTICEGKSFVFGNEEYTTSGTYTQMMTTSNCSAEYTIVLTVIPTPATTNVGATICAGDVYNFEGKDLVATGTYTSMMPSANGCDSTIVLNLVVEPASMHQVATVCFGEGFQFGTETIEVSGNYDYMETTTNGCMTSHTLNLTVLEELTNAALIMADNGQSDGSIMVTVEGGMAPYTFSWDNGADTKDIMNLPAGDYTLVITDANGCMMTKTYTVNLETSTRNLADIYDVKLFPNPVGLGESTTLLIDSPEAAEVILSLYDLTGKRLEQFQVELTQGQNMMEVEAPQVAGVYLLRLMTKEGREQSFRLSVQ